MKMAKASQADIDMAFELANALEAISGRWQKVMPERIARTSDDEETEEFSLDSASDCQRVCTYLVELVRSASLFRVVMGMAVLLDPANRVVDPDAPTIEHHPDVAAALAALAAAQPAQPPEDQSSIETSEAEARPLPAGALR